MDTDFLNDVRFAFVRLLEEKVKKKISIPGCEMVIYGLRAKHEVDLGCVFYGALYFDAFWKVVQRAKRKVVGFDLFNETYSALESGK